MNRRDTTRLLRFFTRAFQDANLDIVADPRKRRGRRWTLPALLKTLLVALVCGQKNLGQTQQLTRVLSPKARRLLGIPRRVPVTTLRDLLVRMDWETLRELLTQLVRAAKRRKALRNDAFPCVVVSMDGKWTHTPRFHPDYTMRYGTHHVVRTITSCLVSSAAKPCVDVHFVSPKRNENSTFQHAYDALRHSFGHVDLVTYDGGACGKANAAYVVKQRGNYLFRLTAEQKMLLAEAEESLADLGQESRLAHTVDPAGKHSVVVRGLWAARQRLCTHWEHRLTFLRVRACRKGERGETAVENRYWVTNLPLSRFTPEQWLKLTRLHWSVENHCHKTFDVSFEEDKRRWVNEPRGMLAVEILRRVAYTLLALFRCVTQRSEGKRNMPWLGLFRLFFQLLLFLGREDQRAIAVGRLDSS